MGFLNHRKLKLRKPNRVSLFLIQYQYSNLTEPINNEGTINGLEIYGAYENGDLIGVIATRSEFITLCNRDIHKLGFVDTDIEQTKEGMRFTPMKHQKWV